MKKIIIITVFLWSFITFLSWFIFNNNVIDSFLNLNPPMKMFTGLLFSIFSISIFVRKKFTFISDFLTNLVLFFCYIMIGNQISLWLMIDNPPTLSQINSMFFNLPSIATVINFIILCFQMKLLKNNSCVKWPSIIVGMNSIIAIIGYILSMPILYFNFTDKIVGMAFDTSACFLLLSSIFIFNKKEKDYSRYSRHSVLFRH